MLNKLLLLYMPPPNAALCTLISCMRRSKDSSCADPEFCPGWWWWGGGVQRLFSLFGKEGIEGLFAVNLRWEFKKFEFSRGEEGGGGSGTHWHQQSNIEHVDIINVRVLEENENVALPLDTSSTDRGSFLRHFDILFHGKFRYITRKERMKLQPYHKAEEH